jgi:TPP-dependent pyruvate/acetoin dehydrogenase alpha subunit
MYMNSYSDGQNAVYTYIAVIRRGFDMISTTYRPLRRVLNRGTCLW